MSGADLCQKSIGDIVVFLVLQVCFCLDKCDLEFPKPLYLHQIQKGTSMALTLASRRKTKWWGKMAFWLALHDDIRFQQCFASNSFPKTIIRRGHTLHTLRHKNRGRLCLSCWYVRIGSGLLFESCIALCGDFAHMSLCWIIWIIIMHNNVLRLRVQTILALRGPRHLALGHGNRLLPLGSSDCVQHGLRCAPADFIPHFIHQTWKEKK